MDAKTTRSFRAEPALWDVFEALSVELECSLDYLLNEALRYFGRLRGIDGSLAGRLLGEPPLAQDAILRQFYCRDTLWDAYTHANQGRPLDAWINEAMRSYAQSRNIALPTPMSEATLSEPLLAFAFSHRSARRYSLGQSSEDVLLGKRFAFFPAGYFAQASLGWVRSLYGRDLTRPSMIAMTGGISIPGVELGGLPPQRFALVVSDREVYRAAPVQLLAIFPGLAGQSALLDLWDESSHLASLPVCVGAHDSAVISLHHLAPGEYRVSLRGADVNEPPCLFRVVEAEASAPEPHYLSGIYLQQGEGKGPPFEVIEAGGRLSLRALAEVSQCSLLLLDPSFPARRSDALEPAQVQHPAQYDSLYQACDRLFQGGQYAEASAALKQARQRQRPPHPYYAYNIACCEALLGHKEKAVSWLRTAIRDGFSDLEHLREDNDLAALRGEKTFEALLSGGKIQLRFEEVKPGDVLALPTFSGAILLGAYVDGIAWEGWGLQWDTPAGAFASVSLAG